MSTGYEPAIETTDRHRAVQSAEAPLPGLLYPEAGAHLHRLAGVAPGEHVVDLAGDAAKSTLWLAAGVHDAGAQRRMFALGRWDDATLGALGKALHGSGAAARTALARGGAEAGALAWPHGISIGLLHFAPALDDFAKLRQAFELWARFVVAGGVCVIDGVPSRAAAARLVAELPRWWRHHSASVEKWIVMKRVDPPVPRL